MLPTPDSLATSAMVGVLEGALAIDSFW